MCVDPGARPPPPPVRGGAVDARDLELTSADGTTFAAHLARAPHAGGAGIVVIPDVRGLHPFYEELARRFAEAGVHALAVDLYARTAGPGRRGDGFDFGPHVLQTRLDTITADVAAAAAALRMPDGGAAERVYAVGFCFGGRAAFLQAAGAHDLAGVIGFYGPPAGPNRAGLPEPVEEAARFRCPVLGLFGGADESIPAAMITRFDGALTAAGVDHRLVTYPGAPHSFFDRSAAQYTDASADAWRQMLAFMGAIGSA